MSGRLHLDRDDLIADVLRAARRFGVDVAKLRRDDFLQTVPYSKDALLREAGPWRSIQAAAAAASGRPTTIEGRPDPRAALRPPPVPKEAPAVDISELDWTEDEDRTYDDPLDGAHVEPASDGRVYVVTYAQNATPAADNFFASLLVYCEHRSAELLVIPGRYKNPTSVWAERDRDDDWWDPRLKPYLLVTWDGASKDRFLRGRRARICDDLIAYGDISIQPTAVRPLTGFDAFAGAAWGIFGHPKIQLRAIPGAEREARVLVTTGAITEPNYTVSKAGAKGAAHHVHGAVIVEVDAVGAFHLRHINATDDGAFIDLGDSYTPWGVEPAERPLALVMGDVHVAGADADVVEATLRAPDSIARALRPERIVYHDLFDMRARSHHVRRDPDAMFERACGPQPDSVEDEVVEAIRFLDETPLDADPIVVPSNHDEHLDRWLREASPNDDPINARFFHELRALKLRRYEADGEWTPALELLYEARGRGRARFLRRDETYQVGSIECGFHGDAGLNGSRGSMAAYARLGAKTVIGHSHTPGILDGCYQVGCTAELDQGYNRTPSSWMHAHCLIYANSKRTLIFVRDGKWRGDRWPNPARPDEVWPPIGGAA